MENASNFRHLLEMQPPIFEIDLRDFSRDPYPALAEMRETAPIAFVPQLGATLITKRDDISVCEKNIAVFSSEQPGGLMTVLMGENMMRRDGLPHLEQRKQAFPSLSPRTVRDVWTAKFEQETDAVLDTLDTQETCDLVTDFAMPVSGHALRHITGLTNLTPAQMDQVSQAMIDGISNYAGDNDTEALCYRRYGPHQRCHAGSQFAIDPHPIGPSDGQHPREHQTCDFGRPERTSRRDCGHHMGVVNQPRTAGNISPSL
jgi:cytochrome P450